MEGHWDREFRIEWHRWKDGRAIVAYANQTTVTMFTNMVAEIDTNGQRFRAWPANEFAHLVTLILPSGTEVFDDVWTLFLAQNSITGYQGQHGAPKMLPSQKAP